MSELYKIIGLRDVDPKIREEFMELINTDSPEAVQIKKGYSNPLIVANIIKCRIKCLEDSE